VDAQQKPGPAKAETKSVSIPKEEVYTTSAEEGFKKRLRAEFYSKDDKPVFPYSYDLKMINQSSRGMGASNIFLVRAEEIAQAVNGTRLVFETGRSADEPPGRDILQKKIKSDRIWLVVYLGAGWSTPSMFRFKSAAIQHQTVEFRYGAKNPMVVTSDTMQYFYWVPLPALKEGTYELKLIDTDKGRPVLVRYVDVPKKAA
jgi:hypothetical protein